MKKRNRRMNLFYIPAVILLLMFIAYPFAQAIRVSFFNWNGYSQNMKFIGIDNYVKMMKDKRFWMAFRNTLVYGFGSTILQNVMGLSFALLVNSRFKGNNVVRTIVYMPIMISSLIMGFIMRFFFTFDNGVLNDIIGWFGKDPVDWLADGTRGVIIITLINSWHYMGSCMIIYLAGLQGIPSMYYEAAAIDGVSKWNSFRYITLPMLIPSIQTAVIVNLIGGLKVYEGVVALTNGGPVFRTHSIMSYVSNQYFDQERAGLAAAIGIFNFIFIMIVSTIGNNLFAKKEVEL
ncbi:MAG: sugar ABC transporter permease [Lachnospiraceae bacterium]|nr:sugar ABC transporter permease [Lachnospiraceae bacterium]